MVNVSNRTRLWQSVTNYPKATSLVCEWRWFLSSVCDHRWMICKLSIPCVIWSPMCICILSANTKLSQTTSKDWVCPLVWIDGSVGVETWTKQPPFEELKGAKLAVLSFLFHCLGFSKCVLKTAFKPVQQSKYDRASACSLPRVKWHVAKLMRIGLKGLKRDSEMKPNAAYSRLRITLLKS